MTFPRVTIIVARARNGVIGRGGEIPWRLPEDMAHFKATTMDHAIIMGRRTFESIGKPLPGRRTIIVTRNPDWIHKGCQRAGSPTEAVALAGLRGFSNDEAFVIGGAQLYSAAKPVANRMLVTEIELEPEGNSFFDPPTSSDWSIQHGMPRTSAAGIKFRIDEWRRVQDGSEH